MKLIYNPTISTKRIRFKGKFISLNLEPRTGVCNLCRFVGLTHMHHTQYDESDPLKHTIEICASCHMKIHH